MARSITDICNEAISDLPASPIASIDDTLTEAEECARHLPGIVSELIAYHDWTHVRKRISLSEVANDRDGEWQKAYALPNKLVSPVRLVPDYGATSNLTVATGQTGATSGPIVLTPVLYYRGTRLASPPIEYEIADGKLYTDLPTPILEYSTDELEPSKWPPLFAQAVIRYLAARIYRPVLGEKADTREWTIKQRAAMMARDEAVADDLNRNPRRRKDFISDAELARQGDYGYGNGQFGTRWQQ